MSIVSLENVSRSYRAEPLLEQVTMAVEQGEKVGLIGVNGCGKSTLLRIVAGREPVDAGRVVVARGTSVSFLSQNPVLDETKSVLDAVFVASTETPAAVGPGPRGPRGVACGADQMARLLHDYEQACHDVAAGGDERALARVSDLAGRLEAGGGWDLETSARTVLSKLGVGDVGAIVGTLSGGQRKRVALAHALIVRPDLLILDEPTNQLDVDAVAWLEDWLSRYTGTLLLVTHDRYFLDRVVGRIVEIDRGAVTSYPGSYSAYVEKKQDLEAQRAAAGEKREALMRRELEWLRRGARARTTRQKARVERAEALLAEPRERAAAGLEIGLSGRRLGTKTIEMRGVSKAFDGRPVVSDFSYTLKKGGRVGIVGPNGAGKTTLLELMAERLAPDAGTVERGPTVVIGYSDQESRALREDLRVIEYVREASDQITMADGRVVTASQMCERFLFSGYAQQTPIARLSGGERRRLYLLRVLMENPNVLLLDEPTNDLDIPTLVRLEDYLDGFAGCLVVVSHDRYFLDRTTDAILTIGPGGRVREHAGNYSDTEEARERNRPEEARPQAVAAAGVQASAKPRKMSMRERRELETLETEIEKGETRVRAIDALLVEYATDASRTHALYEEQQALRGRLDAAMERWAELSEIPQG